LFREEDGIRSRDIHQDFVWREGIDIVVWDVSFVKRTTRKGEEEGISWKEIKVRFPSTRKEKVRQRKEVKGRK